ncbi:hypothetical protein APU90_03960 [Rathayibacter toxicus]|uniref:Uncharacterized protein n=1 Tax=Rathayibacter toxicus TaxID=145458 RepID=A0A0C5BDT9_9MICO|nr:hypothetical protein TI83_02515 [Rathayibacter toxicus]ALS57028.1 hypothetical protein APU90_03960 [Rathayibacter toxicus]KKM46144.1 hypothetical protein VT73_03530 [Rathayibacter toxicus]QOD08037.1 hypothetical protein AYW78_09300 [Rathayibacter toxicus]
MSVRSPIGTRLFALNACADRGFRRACPVERVRDSVKVVVEEVRVDVERHGRGGVAEHPLHRLHVRPELTASDTAVCRKSCSVMGERPDSTSAGKGFSPREKIDDVSALRRRAVLFLR